MTDRSWIVAKLPHGHPMVLVDRVVAVDVGRRLVAHKAITLSEPCYSRMRADWRPEAFAYPTSLLIESFGQAAALLWASSEGGSADSIVMFAAAKQCEVSRRAYPGDVLEHEVVLDRVVAGTAFASGETRVATKRIATFTSIIAVARPTKSVERSLSNA